MLERRNFHGITDHKPLVYAFKKKLDQMSPRQTRHLLFISEFTTNVRHVSGTEKIVHYLVLTRDASLVRDYRSSSLGRRIATEAIYINIFEVQKVYLIGNSIQYLL